MEKFEQGDLHTENEVIFEDNLIKSKISHAHIGTRKFFEIKDNPDKIVRMETFSRLEKMYKGQIDPTTVAEIGQELYSELSDRYGISVPAEFVLGKSKEGEDVVYSIVDKIDGRHIDEIELNPEIIDRVEHLYESIAQYYFDKFKIKDALYLADINSSSQYVYGVKNKAVSPDIHLVDTDLYIRDGKVALCNVVLWLYRHMSAVEVHFDKRFDKARKILEEISSLPIPDWLDDEKAKMVGDMLSKLKSYLRGEKVRDDYPPVFNNLP